MVALNPLAKHSDRIDRIPQDFRDRMGIRSILKNPVNPVDCGNEKGASRDVMRPFLNCEDCASAPRAVAPPIPATADFTTQPSQTCAYGQVGELLRMLLSLSTNAMSGW